jgi:Zn-finger nucleic acid-binding protein
MVADVKVCACESCGGILVQREFLGQVVRRARAEWDRNDSPSRPLDPAELQRRVACPVCHEVMETFAYAGPGCIVVDSCNACDLTWLNGGELLRIAAAPGKR